MTINNLQQQYSRYIADEAVEAATDVSAASGPLTHGKTVHFDLASVKIELDHRQDQHRVSLAITTPQNAILSKFAEIFTCHITFLNSFQNTILFQAWERIAMKKTENILQGGTPKKIFETKRPIWSILEHSDQLWIWS